MISLLYVDDEPALLDLCRIFLEKKGELSVTTVISALDAEKLLESESFDAIISDYQMPEKDGISFLQDVRGRYPEIPFILFTGRGREEIAVRAFELGADFYLQKGGDPKAQFAELTQKIMQAIRRRKAEEALRQSEQYYRALFKYTEAATVIIEEDTTISLANDAFAQLYGSSRDIIEGKIKWTDFVAPEDLEGMVSYHHRRRSSQDDAPTVYEFRFVTSDGSIRNIFAHVGMIPGTMQSVASLLDITERKQTEQRLQESVEQYRNVVEDQTELISRFLPDGTQIFTNEAYCRYFGVKREQIIGTRFRPGILPEDRERVTEFLSTLTPELPVGSMEQRIQMPDGSIRWQRWVDRAIFDADGRLKEYQSVGRDITDMKNVEKALRESEAIYRQLEAQLPDYVLIHEGATIVFVNAEGARLVGKPQEDIIGTSVLSYAAEEYHDLITKNMWLRQQGVPVEPYEIGIIAQSGEQRQVVVRATPIRNRDPPATLTVLTDITDRKKAEGALLASEAKYRTIIEHIQDLVYQTDLEGNLTMINPSGARLTGYASPEEMIGSNIARDLYADPKEREKFLAVLEEKGTVTDYPVILRDRNGVIHYVTASSHIYYNTEGEALGVEGILHDVTGRIQAEDALRQANQKLCLLSDITRHDISNHLTVLRGYLELLGDLPDQASKAYVKNALAAAGRISSMIRFAREYEEIGVEVPAWQEIRELVRRAGTEAPPGQVILENDIPAGTEIFADPLIVRVFYNLIDNAVRYGRTITTIRFSAEHRGDDLIILCEDDGVGVPAPDKERIFERGFGQTNGLGLALSREILSITGLDIRETGGPDKGARFEITVPDGAYR